jgi:hypothetical protein
VATGARLDLAFSSVRLDEPIDAELFALLPPADGRTRLLDLDRPTGATSGGGGP